ncbi:GntR family transcriptional regulator [Slackia piriformis]|nr:GntR family transcriptional regulator [Slackia piriformis]
MSVSAEDKKSLITIDQDSGMPIWLQLRHRLVYLIESGLFEEGERLPTVRELSVSLGINYNTVSKVYQDIERDGYINSKRGKGTFVSQIASRGEAGVKDEAETLTDDYIRRCLELGIPLSQIASLLEGRLEVANGSC